MATDTFTNTNGTALTAHNASWLTPTGNDGMEIQNNTARGIGHDKMNCNYWNEAAATAHYAIATIDGSVSSAAGVAVRIQSGVNSFFFAVYDGGTVFAGQCITGVLTDWDGGQSGFSPGDTVELHIDESTSTTIHLKRNAVTVQTYTGKNAITGGFYGVAGYSDTGTAGITSWEGGNVTAGGFTPRRTLLGVG